jgi:hypothetical protein
MALLGHFILPRTIKIYKEEDTFVYLSKYIEGEIYSYELNKQEISDFIKILSKSKLRRGVFRPERLVADKAIDISVGGGIPHIVISYDEENTYIFATIDNKFYRISNKDDIKYFIDGIVNLK